jgi:two-component system, OmpR family, response regulator ChvI
MDFSPSDSPSGEIVIVDDDGMFRESLIQNLSDAGYKAIGFEDGPTALSHLAQADVPDIILLDWKMPGMTGIEVLRHLRNQNIEAPVVFLTVLSDQIYEEAGLLGGAVDFIEKSRSFQILSRRVALILNGMKGKNGQKAAPGSVRPPAVIRQGDILLRCDVNRAFWRDEKVDLTLTEFRIVEYLVKRAGEDIRYRELYDIVHGVGFAAGEGEIGFRANVRAFIKRIRQKFRDVDPNFEHIENYPGFGYRWSDTDGQ